MISILGKTRLRHLRRTTAACRARAGFSMIEVMIACVFIAVASMGLMQAMVSSNRAEALSIKAQIATQLAESILEEMAAVEPSEIYARYNASVDDDPGTGSSPGSSFPLTVHGLESDDPVALIVFPEVGGILSETAVSEHLGMPRDLNMDGAITAGDRSADYQLLPVEVRVSWGPQSQHSTVLRTMLGFR